MLVTVFNACQFYLLKVLEDSPYLHCPSATLFHSKEPCLQSYSSTASSTLPQPDFSRAPRSDQVTPFWTLLMTPHYLQNEVLTPQLGDQGLFGIWHWLTTCHSSTTDHTLAAALSYPLPPLPYLPQECQPLPLSLSWTLSSLGFCGITLSWFSSSLPGCSFFIFLMGFSFSTPLVSVRVPFLVHSLFHCMSSPEWWHLPSGFQAPPTRCDPLIFTPDRRPELWSHTSSCRSQGHNLSMSKVELIFHPYSLLLFALNLLVAPPLSKPETFILYI